jgi:hypothetical protein
MFELAQFLIQKHHNENRNIKPEYVLTEPTTLDCQNDIFLSSFRQQTRWKHGISSENGVVEAALAGSANTNTSNQVGYS